MKEVVKGGGEGRKNKHVFYQTNRRKVFCSRGARREKTGKRFPREQLEKHYLNWGEAGEGGERRSLPQEKSWAKGLGRVGKKKSKNRGIERRSSARRTGLKKNRHLLKKTEERGRASLFGTLRGEKKADLKVP